MTWTVGEATQTPSTSSGKKKSPKKRKRGGITESRVAADVTGAPVAEHVTRADGQHVHGDEQRVDA